MARRIFEKKNLLTVVVIAAILGFIVASRSRSPQKKMAPEDAVYGMLDAARAGNTTAYLAYFSNPLRDQLEQTAKESSAERFRKYLLSQNAALTGVAVSVTERSSDEEARVRVEYVYRDRNEVQTLFVRKASSDWKIYQATGSSQIKTLIPYGTIVAE